MNPDKGLRRRSIRIAGAGYTEAGAYFITICAAHRQNTFGKVEHGRVMLSGLGAIVRACWVQIPEHFPAARIQDFVVMPNHLHGIVVIGAGARYIVPSEPKAYAPERFQKPVKGSIPTVVRTFKAAVSRKARKELGMGVEKIWQSIISNACCETARNTPKPAGIFWRIRRDGDGTTGIWNEKSGPLVIAARAGEL